MAKDEVLFRYALLDDSNHTVSIDDIDRSFTRLHKFYCPHCHNEMYATFGDVQQSHFRHNGDKCQYSKYLHDLAEYVFNEEYSKCLDTGQPFFLELHLPTPCNKACVLNKHADCKEHYIQKTVDLTKEYTIISLESRVDIENRYRRPDILLESLDCKQLWVEIWVSHETEEEKRKDGRIIEIKINREKDLEKIRQHKIVQSEGDDLDVRIFGIETDGTDVVFEDEEAISSIKYPCEQYYCFEVGKMGVKTEILDSIKTTVSTDLLFRVIVRLNWKGSHNAVEGETGTKFSDDNLRAICTQRFNSYGKSISQNLDKSLDSLIIHEWKSSALKLPRIPSTRSYHRSNIYSRHHSTSSSAPVSVDFSNIEWVDLGLPSGTLWAKTDIDGKMSFDAAMKSGGSHMPSRTNADELIQHCTKKWDDSVHALVFTGPNGNSISFPCKENNKSYWLNAYEQGDSRYGQCFHIGPDGHFFINNSDAYSAIYIRLVSR